MTSVNRCSVTAPSRRRTNPARNTPVRGTSGGPWWVGATVVTAAWARRGQHASGDGMPRPLGTSFLRCEGAAPLFEAVTPLLIVTQTTVCDCMTSFRGVWHVGITLESDGASEALSECHGLHQSEHE